MYRYELMWIAYLIVCAIGFVACLRRSASSPGLLLAAVGFGVKGIIFFLGTTSAIQEHYFSSQLLVETMLEYSPLFPYVELAALAAIVFGLMLAIPKRREPPQNTR